MQCSVTLGRDRTSGNKMKTINNYKNPYRKEPNLDNIVDQLCTRLQDIKDQESAQVGMPTCTLEHTEAVRRYYAAFPALKKGQESPLQYYLPPPAWCRKTAPDDIKMQCELSVSKDWSKNKKFTSKERRNSYHHAARKHGRRRCNSYSRSFESKDSLPEWMTHEGAWDLEAQDPVKEFIRAIALDEGYGTCENTVTDDLRGVGLGKMAGLVPGWDAGLDLDAGWVIKEDLNPRVRTPMEEELYAKFEAKFDRSIEALWSKEQNTPDDEYQDLPIDFQDLLSSPSDRLFADPSAEKCSLISLTESIWSNEGLPAERETASRAADALHARLKPLQLADAPPPPLPAPAAVPRELESFTLYEGEEMYDALSTVADTMRSFTALNHSRERSGFAEVPPRRRRPAPAPAPPRPEEAAADERRTPSREREDLLTSARTHFRPIRREGEPEHRRYNDGDTFDIRGDLDAVEFRRSASGGVYLEDALYLEYRTRSIDYDRLNLTEAQRCPDLDDPGFRLRFPLRQTDAGVQTDAEVAWGCEECGRAAKKMRPMSSIWSAGGCAACAPPPAAEPARAPPPPPDELSREWEELLSDISAAHAEYTRADLVEEALVSADRKRRHSAALRAPAPGGGACAGAACRHPHARFLHCAALAADRPLTR